MKILYIIDSLETGGAERLVIDTANQLFFLNIKVQVVTTVKERGTLKNLLNKNIPCNYIDCNWKNIFSGVQKLRKHILSNGITHVHAHLYHSMIISRLACFKNLKLFATYHNLEYDPSDMFFSRSRVLLDKITLRKSYTSLFVSAPVMHVVQHQRGKSKRDYVLYNFPSNRFITSYTFNSTPALKLVTVGSVKPVKNFSFLLRAFKFLKEENIFLDIYGDGESMDELQNFIDTNDLFNVCLKGKANIDSDLLSNYDVFVMSSYSEGMPVALIEAITTGLPSLLPDHLQVMKDVAADSALYFDINKEKSFVDRVLTLLNNKEGLIAMSEKAIVRSKDFSLQKHIEKLLTIYHSI